MAAELPTEVAWKLHHTASFSGAMLCFSILHNCQEKTISIYIFLESETIKLFILLCYGKFFKHKVELLHLAAVMVIL